jgi:hypothetical protein
VLTRKSLPLFAELSLEMVFMVVSFYEPHYQAAMNTMATKPLGCGLYAVLCLCVID